MLTIIGIDRNIAKVPRRMPYPNSLLRGGIRECVEPFASGVTVLACARLPQEAVKPRVAMGTRALGPAACK